MVLYGSQTSPFVRRIRLLLPPTSHEFRRVDIFNPQEREELLKLSPLLKIPILYLDEEIIWDSRVIFNELCKRKHHEPLTLKQENLLTAISDLSDSLVQKLLSFRSQLTLPDNTPIAISHQERIQNTLRFLNEETLRGSFQDWNFISMSLFSLIDWIQFRDLVDLNPYSHLLTFKEKNKNQPQVKLTDPRLKL